MPWRKTAVRQAPDRRSALPCCRRSRAGLACRSASGPASIHPPDFGIAHGRIQADITPEAFNESRNEGCGDPCSVGQQISKTCRASRRRLGQFDGQAETQKHDRQIRPAPTRCHGEGDDGQRVKGNHVRRSIVQPDGLFEPLKRPEHQDTEREQATGAGSACKHDDFKGRYDGLDPVSGPTMTIHLPTCRLETSLPYR